MYPDSTLTHLPNVYKILNGEKGGNYDKKIIIISNISNNSII